MVDMDQHTHGLRTPREEIAFTARPKIHSHSQIFRYGRSIFCLPHRPDFSDIFDLCHHRVSVVHEHTPSIRVYIISLRVWAVCNSCHLAANLEPLKRNSFYKLLKRSVGFLKFSWEKKIKKYCSVRTEKLHRKKVFF